MDQKVTQHAKVLVNYSTRVKERDNVLIQLVDHGMDVAMEIYKETARLGASPLIVSTPTEAMRSYYDVVPEQYLDVFPRHLYELTKASDVVISIRGEGNTRYLSNVDPKRISKRTATLREIMEERLRKRWCLTQCPSQSYAQEAEMSLAEYENFVYSSILVDWAEEAKKMLRLKEVMNRAAEVRLIGTKTDLTMSIRSRIAIVDDGTHNMPGGEVFTAPIERSVEGEVYFDLPALSYGKEVTDVWLKFRAGDVVDFSASKNVELLKSMINTDAGSRRLGELGVGMNRGISRFTRNILFDEKIGDTIHLALGRAYKECGGTNESAVHWDMIKTMKPGQILLDGEVVQRDGKFSWE